MSPRSWKILIVEDLPIYVGLLNRMLRPLNSELDSAGSLAESLEKVRAQNYDLVILDLGLPDSQGLATFKNFKSNCTTTPIIVFSGTDDEELAVQAVQSGAQDYLIKGSYLTQGEAGASLLIRSVTYAIERHRIQEELILERSLLEHHVTERTAELRSAVEQLQVELAERRRYEFMINTTQDPTILVDANERFQAVNDAYCRLHDLPREQIIGIPVEDIEGKVNFQAYFQPMLVRAMAGHRERFEGWLNLKTSGHKYYDIAFSPFLSTRDHVSHVVIVFHDETVRKAAEDRIRHHNYRLNVLRQIDQASLSLKSPEAIARVVLENFHNLVPYDRADILIFNESGANMLMVTGGVEGKVTAKQAPAAIVEFFQSVTTSFNDPYRFTSLQDIKAPNPFEVFLKQRGLRTNLSAPLYAEGHLLGVLSLSSADMDIFTEEHYENAQAMCTPLALMIRNSQLLQELAAANFRLRNLAAWLVSAQEDERHRISLELHDESGQFLTALKLSLNMIENQLDGVSASVKNQLHEANRLTEEIMDRLRTLAHDLRPPGLDTVGLNQALNDYCQRVSRQTGLVVNYQGPEVVGLPAHIQTSLYRMAQEALTNILKHAQAQMVDVKLEFDAEQVSLEIKDNGCGFDLPPDPEIRMVGGIGLLGIHDRMEAIGGVFKVDSEPGKGTRLSARIPLQEVV